MGVSPVAPSVSRSGSVAWVSGSKLHEQCLLGSAGVRALPRCVYPERTERGGLGTQLDACSRAWRCSIDVSEGGESCSSFQYLNWETMLWLVVSPRSNHLIGFVPLRSLITDWGWVAGIFG